MVTAIALAFVFVLASAAAGHAILATVGVRRPTWLAAAVGFAALTVAAGILIRLPGRAVTAAIIIGLALAVGLWVAQRRDGFGQEPAARPVALGGAVAVTLVAFASVPLLLHGDSGVLGEGIYTNDQAAQLYWTDWLKEGFGPEPSAVSWGYPVGPQSLVAVTAEVTGASLVDAFNGLLIAIPALTGLVALCFLGRLSWPARLATAIVTGLPFLAASFLAQSAFKETAMALLVLGFAGTLAQASGGRPPVLGRRAAAGALGLFALAGVMAYSVPGLVWFALTFAAWLGLEVVLEGRRLDLRAGVAILARHRRALALVLVGLVALAIVGGGRLSEFAERIGDVQASTGRLSSPVFPGEALGVWPEGDFRVVRGEVSGSLVASALALAATSLGALALLRRRAYALVGALAAGVAVYAGARLFANIHVEAKALAVLAPLAICVALAGLFSLRWRVATWAGAAIAICAAASTFLALREAPVGFDGRGEELESLAERIQGDSVAFLGVDRFAAYWLRGTLVESPGGYVPPEVRARPEKVWQQGDAMDLDTLPARRLDRFDYAITTTAAYQSSPPANMREVARTDSYVLWERRGETPRLAVLPHEDGAPGVIASCPEPDAKRGDVATILPKPEVARAREWTRQSPFEAPASAHATLRLNPGRWQLSLQYHSQVDLHVGGPGLRADVPASLAGMYLTHQGQGAFWPVGEIRVTSKAPVEITVAASKPDSLERALGAPRRVWLGDLAAMRLDPLSRRSPKTAPLAGACGEYVDHFGSRRAVATVRP